MICSDGIHYFRNSSVCTCGKQRNESLESKLAFEAGRLAGLEEAAEYVDDYSTEMGTEIRAFGGLQRGRDEKARVIGILREGQKEFKRWSKMWAACDVMIHWIERAP